MDRRTAISTLGSAIPIYLGCGCRAAMAQFPGQSPGLQRPKAESPFPPGVHLPDGKDSSLSLTHQRGCSLAKSRAAAAFGPTGARLRKVSGIPFLDHYMPLEARVLSDRFGVSPGFAFLVDFDAPNAFATPEAMYPGTDGTVAFGLRLVADEGLTSGEFVSWTTALVGIMAHEWAHILSFEHGLLGSPSKQMELLADYLAGWYIGWKVASGMRSINPQAFAASVFNKGDYSFNSASHHGTPAERLDAMVRGYNCHLHEGISSSQKAFVRGTRLVGL